MAEPFYLAAHARGHRVACSYRAVECLAGQVAVAMVVWSQGVRIGAIDLPWASSTADAVVLPGMLSLIATVIWLVGITNAINWLDGLDGLAAGVAGIAAIGLVSVSFSLHQVAAAFLAAALAGSCLGFLRHNFNPARIFMGDGGSYFLGFSLAAISIVGPAKGLTTVSLLLPLLILSLPLADMSAVIMGRLSSGHSPFYPDRRHLHHRKPVFRRRSVFDQGLRYKIFSWSA